MKKVIKIILTIVCWICAIFLIVESVKSFIYSDSWGLELAFYTLPVGILGILFLVLAVYLTKEVVTNKSNTNG